MGGQAHPRIRTLFGLIEPRQIDSDWADELITHELAHVFHIQLSDSRVPRWFTEGLESPDLVAARARLEALVRELAG